MNLRDFTDIFKDDLLDVLTPKLQSLDTELLAEEALLGIEQAIARSNLVDAMNRDKIPFTERSLYWSLVSMLTGNEHKKRVAELQRERRNIVTALRCLEDCKTLHTTNLGAKTPKLDIEGAKVVDVADLYQGNLKKAGKDHVGLCPFHSEKTPSFHVYADGHYHCFSCGAHGTSIDFIMQTEGLKFADAVRELTCKR